MTLRGSDPVSYVLGENLLLVYAPAPTKLYRPIVSVVAALSNRNDSLDFDLKTSSQPAVPPRPAPKRMGLRSLKTTPLFISSLFSIMRL
jgi:hypothetical protein